MIEKLQSARPDSPAARERPSACGRYLTFMAVANLAWELVHLPLYTIWEHASAGDLVFAVLHCTGGDLLIAATSLLLAVVLLGGPSWPRRRYGAVAFGAMAAGLVYTVFSEWFNVELRGAWAYRSQMPVLPILGTGLSPLLQWLILPALAFRWARRRSPDRAGQ